MVEKSCLKNKYALFLATFIFSLLVFFSGCIFTSEGLELVTPEGPPDTKATYSGYHKTELKKSTSAEVLNIIHLPEYEFLTQSESVIVTSGKKKRGHKAWFKMVAFDEDSLLARRKYLFVEDERPKTLLFTEPWEYAVLDCQIVLDREILDEPYGSEDERRIAVIREIKELFNTDISEVKEQYQLLVQLGPMVNQCFESALVQLDRSPVFARLLNTKEGIEFYHNSLDKGRIRMVIEDDVVTMRIMAGSIVKRVVGGEMYPGFEDTLFLRRK